MKTIWIILLMAGAVWADETITALGRKWSVPLAADWKGGSGVLELLAKNEPGKPRRPKQFAVLQEGPYSASRVLAKSQMGR